MAETDASPALTAAMVATIAAGAWLRFSGLGQRGLWWDELYTVVSSSTSATVGELWRGWMVDDSHPPGFQPLIWLWFRLVPATEVWARLPSALAGTAMLLYAAFGTRSVLSPTARAILTSLLAFGYLPVYYAQEARPYALLALACLVVGDVALRLLREDRPRLWVALVVAGLCASYLHYFGLFVTGLWFGLLASTRSRAWGAALGTLALLYLPGFARLAHLVATSNGMWARRAELSDFVPELLGGLLLQDLGPTLAVVAAMGWVAVLGGDASGGERVRPRSLAGLTVFLGAAAVVVTLANQRAPVLQARFYVALLPAAATTLAVGLAWALQPASVGWRLAVVALPALALVTWVPGYQQDFVKQGWREATAWVVEHHQDGDLVGVLGPDGTQSAGELLAEGRANDFFWLRNHDYFAWYLRRQGAPELADALVRWPNEPSAAPLPERLILLAGHHLPPDDAMQAELGERYASKQLVRYKSTLITVFDGRR